MCYDNDDVDKAIQKVEPYEGSYNLANADSSAAAYYNSRS